MPRAWRQSMMHRPPRLCVGASRGDARVQPELDFARLHERFRDPIQRRYELMRPVMLLQDRTATQRAEETHSHPETIGALKRRFAQHGMLGLLPSPLHVGPSGRQGRVPDAVMAELSRLQGLYDGFASRALCRVLFYKLGYHVSDKTVKKLWDALPPTSPRQLPLLDYHSYPDPSQARQEVIALYFQGWNRLRISRFLRVSRPTINEWISRFESDNLASLEERSRAPQAPVRKVWLPVMLDIYHLHKRHPDAGRFRIWSVLGHRDISVRTVGRVMALNKRIYDDLPHVRRKAEPRAPQPHPYKAQTHHEYWCIDGRQMDFKIDGGKWWSLIVLDGYSRTMLAGAVAPSEASWGALMVLHTACLRYGAPQYLISDKGGASISDEFEAVCQRLGIDHKKMTSTQGESSLHIIETHFNIQRRLYDSQLSLTRTPLEFEPVHQDCMHLYNTTAHQGLLKEHFEPPMPLDVLGEAKGRLYTPDELEQKFARALLPRTTNRFGCVTLHSYHFYVEAGLPQTQVLLWVYGSEWRAVFENVVFAEYHCRYDLRQHQVKDIRDGRFYATRFASPQGALLPFNPQESLVVQRQRPLMYQARLPFPAQQLWLFEYGQPA